MTTKELYIIKWTNLLTGKFGFSATPQSLEDTEAQCKRMKALTAGRWVDEDGNKHNYRGSYEPVGWEGRG